jgi:hypothetical protein
VNQRFGQNPFLFGCNCQLLFSPDLKTSKSKIDEKCQNRVFFTIGLDNSWFDFCFNSDSRDDLDVDDDDDLSSRLSFKVTKPSVHLANKQ